MKAALGVLRLAVPISLFFLVFSRVDSAALAEALSRTRPWPLLLAFGLGFAGNAAASIVAKKNLDAVGVAKSQSEILRINYFSYFYSLLHTLAGGWVRWRGLSDKGGRAQALFVIMVERFQALCVLSIFFWASLPLWRRPYFHPWEARFFSTLAAALAGAVFSGCLILFVGPRLLWRVPWGGIGSFVAVAADYARVPSRFIRCLGWSAVYLVVQVVVFALFAAAVSVPIGGALFGIFTLLALADLFPLTVFGFGVREALLVYVMPRFGVPAGQALCLGLLVGAAALFHAGLGGVWTLWELIRRENR